MYGIDDATAVAVQPTPEAANAEGFFSEGNPGAGQVATNVRASWLNTIQAELRAIVVAAGLTPSKTTQNQVLSAIRSMTGGIARVSGLRGANNGTTGVAMTADRVCLRAPPFGLPSSGSTVVFDNVPLITTTFTTAGPVAGGRDQAAAFVGASEVHVYYISDGTNLSTIASLNNPTVGPTLPGAYKYWAYATTVKLDGSANVIPHYLKGAWVQYVAAQTVVNGGSTSLVSVNISGYVPSIALNWEMTCTNLAISGGSGSFALTCNIVVAGTAVNASFGMQGYTPSASIIAGTAGFGKVMPNVNQNFAYQLVVGAGTGPVVSLSVGGYTIPNGDS